MSDLITTGRCPVCKQQTPLKVDGALRPHPAPAPPVRGRGRPTRCLGSDRTPTAVYVPPAPCQCRDQVGHVEAGSPHRGRFRAVYTCRRHITESQEYVTACTGHRASNLIPFPTPASRRSARV